MMMGSLVPVVLTFEEIALISEQLANLSEHIVDYSNLPDDVTDDETLEVNTVHQFQISSILNKLRDALEVHASVRDGS